MFDQVRKENPKLSPATMRREAARRMGTDYDTYLKAWKKPTTEPVTPPPITVPDPPITVVNPVKPITVKKAKDAPFNFDWFSSTLRTSAKDSTRITYGDRHIGFVQRTFEGSYERDAHGVRTGRFFIDKRGWSALDENGKPIKDGFKVVFDSQDDAIKVLTKRAEIKPEPPVRLPTPTPQPAPEVPVLNYDTARAQFKQVLKENKAFTQAQARREAARRMNVDYDTYLKAWKGDAKAATPITPPAPTVPTTEPEVVKQGLEPTVTNVHNFLQSKGHDADVYSLRALDDGTLIELRVEDLGIQETRVVRDIFTKELQDAGYIVDRVGPYNLKISKPGRLIRTARDENPPWKVKAGNSGDVTIEDGYVFEGQQQVGKIVYERGFWRMRPSYGETRLNADMIFRSYDDAAAAAKKMVTDGINDLGAVNPGRFRGVTGTSKNCTSCSSTYELRRRGFDVVARKMPNGQALTDIYRSWGIRVQDQALPEHLSYLKPSTGWTYPISTPQAQGIKWLESQPDGARGFINCVWKRGGAHIFNWEKRNGKIWFIDAQINMEWEFRGLATDGHFRRMDGDIWLARLDELAINPDLLRWLTSDTGQVPVSGAPKWVSMVQDHQKNPELT